MNNLLADRIARVITEIRNRSYYAENREERWGRVLQGLQEVEPSIYQEIEPRVEFRTRTATWACGGSVVIQEPGFILSEFIPHSASGPSLGTRSSFRYMLFGYYLSQDEWFDVLGYSSEDRLAHIFKYGQDE